MDILEANIFKECPMLIFTYSSKTFIFMGIMFSELFSNTSFQNMLKSI